jgi:hypothetical protein
MEEVSATAEPEIPPKIMLASIFIRASPPRTQPIKELEKATIRSVIPPEFITAPARTKKGIAIRGKESIPPTILCTTIARGTFSSSNRKVRLEIPKDTAIGIPIRARIRKSASKSNTDISHSPFL